VSKKDILADGALQPIKVGESVYVWAKDGTKPTDASRSCLISAHGLQAKTNTAFPVPDIKLYFYAPHGYVLSDPGVGNVGRGMTRWYEEVAAGSAGQDYELSKYQGRHSKANETYGEIQKPLSVDTLRTPIEAEKGQVPDFRWIDDEEKRKKVRADRLQEIDDRIAGIKEFDMDVVTIRNRKMYASMVTLFQLMKLLKDNGFKYAAAHCSFCRGPRTGKDVTWTTSNNK
jgi:hypothetical protein